MAFSSRCNKIQIARENAKMREKWVLEFLYGEGVLKNEKFSFRGIDRLGEEFYDLKLYKVVLLVFGLGIEDGLCLCDLRH